MDERRVVGGSSWGDDSTVSWGGAPRKIKSSRRNARLESHPPSSACRYLALFLDSGETSRDLAQLVQRRIDDLAARTDKPRPPKLLREVSERYGRTGPYDLWSRVDTSACDALELIGHGRQTSSSRSGKTSGCRWCRKRKTSGQHIAVGWSWKRRTQAATGDLCSPADLFRVIGAKKVLGGRLGRLAVVPRFGFIQRFAID